MYEDLMEKTKCCLKSFKMILAILNEMKNYIPSELFIEKIGFKEDEFKKQFASLGHPFDRHF